MATPSVNNGIAKGASDAPLLIVQFAHASDQVSGRDRSRIEKLAAELDLKELILLIVGFTDDIGPLLYNHGLSRRRAKAVADVLKDCEIPHTSLVINGLAKSEYLATNDDPKGRARNRRVEIFSIKQPLPSKRSALPVLASSRFNTGGGKPV